MAADTQMGTDVATRDATEWQANHVDLSPLAYLDRAARAFGERTAFIDGSRRWTYRQLRERVHRQATALQGIGIRGGDRVAVLAPNSPMLLEAHFGVPLAGAVLVPINTRLAPAEIGYILRHAGARALLLDAELEASVAPVLADCPDLQHVIVAGGPDRQRHGRSELDYDAFLGGGAEQAAPPSLARGEDTPICILYTSGTTGQPKGVVYTHRGAYLNALSVAFELRMGPDSVYLWVLPMFHCSGWSLTWGVVAAGATSVNLRKVDPPRVWELIEREGVTHLCAAPTVVIGLANDPSARPQAPRRGGPIRLATGGAPPSPTTIAQMSALGVEVIHLYGLTETYGPSLACAWWPEWDARPVEERAAIKARQGVPPVAVAGARVVDEQMRDVPADGRTMGEVVIRSNTVMAGYYQDPEATARAFRGGWFHTGDLGVLHADGYVELRDRAKDVVISGGENISTIEVEQVLLRHDAVLEAAVVGIPDPKWGEVPKAFVTLKPGGQATEAELIEFCKRHLARFKAPRVIEFGELPKTSTGKIQKFVLRAREWRGHDRMIN
jgi:fatty-acyl-CoA synthase